MVEDLKTGKMKRDPTLGHVDWSNT